MGVVQTFSIDEKSYHSYHVINSYKNTLCGWGKVYEENIPTPPHCWKNLITGPIIISKRSFALLPLCLIDFM